VIIYDNGDNLW